MVAGSPEAHRLEPNGGIPNSPLPLLVYREAVPPTGDRAEAMQRIFAANGWGRGWRNGITGSTISTAPPTRCWASPRGV